MTYLEMTSLNVLMSGFCLVAGVEEEEVVAVVVPVACSPHQQYGPSGLCQVCLGVFGQQPY